MKELHELVEKSQEDLNDLLRGKELDITGFSKEQYIRYLQMQYHLTNGVQKHFMRVASHHSFRTKKSFRSFLVDFAYEEESHYLIAQKDLEKLGASVGDVPLGVTLWKLYFESILDSNPLIRLGATAILENISSGVVKPTLDKVMSNSNFLTESNTRFIKVHRHEELPHGDEILRELSEYGPSQEEYNDILLGAKNGSSIFQGLLEWIVGD